jgi:hypothetical protein
MAKRVQVNVPVQELKLDLNVNRFLHPLRMVISGPTLCGKVNFFKIKKKH